MRLRPLHTLPTRLRHGDKPDQTGLAATYRTLFEAASQAQRARVPQMAAALTYRTIFGLLPVLIVGLVTVRLLAEKDDIERLIRNLLDTTGISAIVVESDSPTDLRHLPSDQHGPPAPIEVPSQAGNRTPDAPIDQETGESVEATAVAQQRTTQRLDEWVQDILARVEDISFATLGLIGLGALIYAAIGMLVEIERAFNQIYRVPTGRSWSRRLLLYWTMLTLGPLGLVATFYVGSQFRSLADKVITENLAGMSTGLSAVSVVALGYLSTLTISAGVLTLLYIAVPNARVRFWPAIMGAILAAIAWEAAKWGLTYYIDYTRGRSYVNLYGSVALFPLFLLWVYFTWVIVLVGLQLAFQLQYRNRPDPASLLADTRSTLTDPAAAIGVLAQLGRSFIAGKARSARQLAPATGMPEPVVAVMLRQLQEHGFVHRVANGNAGQPSTANADPDADTPRPRPTVFTPDQIDALSGDELIELANLKYTLARPPGLIRLADVLDCVHAMTPNARLKGLTPGDGTKDDRELETAVGAILSDVRTSERRALGERTLADLLPAELLELAEPATPADKASEPPRGGQNAVGAAGLARGIASRGSPNGAEGGAGTGVTDGSARSGGTARPTDA